MDLCVLGGDARFGILCELAAELGHRVICCGLDKFQNRSALGTDSVEIAIKSCKIIILPLPLTKDGETLFAPLSNFTINLKDITKHLTKDHFVLGGMIPQELKQAIQNTGAYCEDYFEREELTITNAISTAEGTLETVMRETDYTVFGSKILIVGYGHVGKAVAHKFLALGSKVTVSARKSRDYALIKQSGLRAIPTAELRKYVKGFDVVINTVPAPVIDQSVISAMNEKTLVVELASLPGGIDNSAALQKGIKVIVAASLPGKVAPRSAATAILETITSILDENNLE